MTTRDSGFQVYGHKQELLRRQAYRSRKPSLETKPEPNNLCEANVSLAQYKSRVSEYSYNLITSDLAMQSARIYFVFISKTYLRSTSFTSFSFSSPSNFRLYASRLALRLIT